jgi:hypothetical protein
MLLKLSSCEKHVPMKPKVPARWQLNLFKTKAALEEYLKQNCYRAATRIQWTNISVGLVQEAFLLAFPHPALYHPPTRGLHPGEDPKPRTRAHQNGIQIGITVCQL